VAFLLSIHSTANRLPNTGYNEPGIFRYHEDCEAQGVAFFFQSCLRILIDELRIDSGPVISSVVVASPLAFTIISASSFHRHPSLFRFSGYFRPESIKKLTKHGMDSQF
jgi:hypothetical protein